MLSNPREVKFHLREHCGAAGEDVWAQSYVALRSIRALVDELRERGFKTKVRQTRSGPIGGTHFGRGPLAVMLRNPIYVGKVRHRDALEKLVIGALAPLLHKRGEHASLPIAASWTSLSSQTTPRGG